MEEKIKHLEFIQNVINRLAKNSFMLKGWAITVVAAMLTFTPKDGALKPVVTVCALIFIFWLLDSYYLWQEKLFRALYDQARIQKKNEIDFNMNTNKFSGRAKSYWMKIFISKTVSLFYLSLMIFTTIYFYWK